MTQQPSFAFAASQQFAQPQAQFAFTAQPQTTFPAGQQQQAQLAFTAQPQIVQQQQGFNIVELPAAQFFANQRYTATETKAKTKRFLLVGIDLTDIKPAKLQGGKLSDGDMGLILDWMINGNLNRRVCPVHVIIYLQAPEVPTELGKVTSIGQGIFVDEPALLEIGQQGIASNRSAPQDACYPDTVGFRAIFSQECAPSAVVRVEEKKFCLPEAEVRECFRRRKRSLQAIKNVDFFGTVLPHCRAEYLNEAIASLIIHFGNSKEGHQNVLFFDLVNGTVERFEPNGSVAEESKLLNWIDDSLRSYLKTQAPSIQYQPVSVSCPRLGLQHKSKERIGYCQAWSLLMTQLKLLNPEWSIRELTERLLADYTSEQLLDAIQRYVSLLYQMTQWAHYWRTQKAVPMHWDEVQLINTALAMIATHPSSASQIYNVKSPDGKFTINGTKKDLEYEKSKMEHEDNVNAFEATVKKYPLAGVRPVIGKLIQLEKSPESSEYAITALVI